MNLPDRLNDTIAGWPGDGATDWVRRLPDLIRDAEARWGLDIHEPFRPGGVVSFAAPASRSDGSQVVYKCTIPHNEAIGEAAALRAYDGNGAVRVLASNPDTYELVVERCNPGTSAWAITKTDERNETISGLMLGLWMTEPGSDFADLDTVAAAWADLTEARLSTLGELLTDRQRSAVSVGAELLRDLPGTADDQVLLHQDLHPGNVLRAERQPWLVIDPKPMVGDPAFDPIQMIMQDDGAFAVEPVRDEAQRRLEHVSDLLDLDPDRVAAWGCARSAEWSMFDMEAGNEETAVVLADWAAVFADLVV